MREEIPTPPSEPAVGSIWEHWKGQQYVIGALASWCDELPWDFDHPESPWELWRMATLEAEGQPVTVFSNTQTGAMFLAPFGWVPEVVTPINSPGDRFVIYAPWSKDGLGYSATRSWARLLSVFQSAVAIPGGSVSRFSKVADPETSY